MGMGTIYNATTQNASSSSVGGMIAKNVPTGGSRRRGRPIGKGRKGVMQLASRVNKISKQLAFDQQINAFDQNFGSGVSSTGLIQAISNCAQGDDYFNRSGNTITVKSLYIRLAINTSSASTANQLCRFILFIDRSSNGTPPTVAEVLSAVAINAPLNFKNKGRFYILRDRTYAFSQGNNDIMVDKFYKQFKPDLSVTYLTTLATDPSLGCNQLYVLMLSDQGLNTPTFSWYSRLKYIP